MSSLRQCISSFVSISCKNCNVIKETTLEQIPGKYSILKDIRWIKGQPKAKWLSWLCEKRRELVESEKRGRLHDYLRRSQNKQKVPEWISWYLPVALLLMGSAEQRLWRAVKSTPLFDSPHHLKNSFKKKKTTDIVCTIFYISKSLETIKKCPTIGSG